MIGSLMHQKDSGRFAVPDSAIYQFFYQQSIARRWPAAALAWETVKMLSLHEKSALVDMVQFRFYVEQSVPAGPADANQRIVDAIAIYKIPVVCAGASHKKIREAIEENTIV